MMGDDEEEDDNSMGVGRYPVMPSLVALQQMRNRLQLASLGRKLMKWTMLATGKKMRKMSVKIVRLYQDYGTEVKTAFILLARCRYFHPSINKMVLANVKTNTYGDEATGETEKDQTKLKENKARVRIVTTYKMVSGVKLVKYDVRDSGEDPNTHLGIGLGGQQIAKTKDAWYKLLMKCITICEMRRSYALIIAANLNATKKLNVLRNVVIPRTLASIRYIKEELEERAREDFYRYKKVIGIAKKTYKNRSDHIDTVDTKQYMPSTSRFETPYFKDDVNKAESVINKDKDDADTRTANGKILDRKEKVKKHQTKVSKSNLDINTRKLTNMLIVSPQSTAVAKFSELKAQLSQILKITRDVDGSLFVRSCVSDFLEMADFLKDIIASGEGTESQSTHQENIEKIDVKDAHMNVDDGDEIDKKCDDLESNLELDLFTDEVKKLAHNIKQAKFGVKSEDNITSKHNLSPCSSCRSISICSVSSDKSINNDDL